MTDRIQPIRLPGDCAEQAQAHASRLPWLALLALTSTSFIATANESLPAGLLPQISNGLGVSSALAGQLVTLCALGAGIGAMPLAAATQSWGRRQVLLLALTSFCVCNAVTALTTSYALALVARFAGGLATGLAWTELATCTRLMVASSQQGRALAIVMIGIPLALSLGVPLSAWLGGFVDWRWIFGGTSAISLLLMAWVFASLSDAPGQARGAHVELRRVLGRPGVKPVLTVVLLWVVAHYLLYTYIAPFIGSLGLASFLDKVLLIFGVCTMGGLWGIGWYIDTHLRVLVLASLGLFALSGVTLSLVGSPVAVLLCVAAWGFGFSGAPTLLQTALADAAGEDAGIAQAMLVTVFNLAFAGSGLLGGVLLATVGAATLPRVLASLACAATLTVWIFRRHAFPAGYRGARR